MTVAELAHGPIAVALGQVAVQQANLIAAALQLRLQDVGSALCLHKDERHGDVGLIQDACQRVGLVSPGRLHVQLANAGDDLRAGADFDGDGVAHVTRRNAAHPLRHRGAEEHGLPLCGTLAQDALDVRCEAHVEHAVGLVEYRPAHIVETHRAALQVVAQPSGSGDDDVHTASQLLHLAPDGVATVHRERAHLVTRGETRQLVVDLHGELTRRAEDQRLHEPGGGIEALDDGNAKRCSLAAARVRLADDVPSRERRGDGAGLDRGRRLEPQLRDRVAHGRAKAQPIEADRLRDLCRSPIDRHNLSGTGPCDMRSSEPHPRTRTQDTLTIPDARRSQTFTIGSRGARGPVHARSAKALPGTRQ